MLIIFEEWKLLQNWKFLIRYSYQVSNYSMSRNFLWLVFLTNPSQARKELKDNFLHPQRMTHLNFAVKSVLTCQPSHYLITYVMSVHTKILIESIFNCFDYSTNNLSLKMLRKSIVEKEEKRKQICSINTRWNISKYIIERALQNAFWCSSSFWKFISQIHSLQQCREEKSISLRCIRQ